MMKIPILTIEVLREWLSYDPLTGVFIWIKSPANTVPIGSIAGHIHHGYIRICIQLEELYAHQLAWFYMTGEWPEKGVDHIDGVKNNNIFTNLRKANQQQNGGNQKKSRNNTSGFKGVYKNKKRFSAGIHVNYKKVHLGTYDTPEEAAAVYDIAALHHFGEFALTNKMLGLL